MGHYVYIDNLGCFSDSIDKVTGIIGRAQHRFSECGLGLHEVEVHEYGGNALGMTMDGKKLLTRNTWKRYIHIHAALTAVLHMRVVSGGGSGNHCRALYLFRACQSGPIVHIFGGVSFYSQ